MTKPSGHDAASLPQPRINLFELHQRLTAHLFPSYSSTDERFLALALAGEVGELANMIKKRWRDGADLTPEIRDEIADIRVYLELMAKCFGIEGEKLDAQVQGKLQKVAEKHKERLSGAASLPVDRGAPDERGKMTAEQYWKRHFEWKQLAQMDDTDTHYSPGEVCRFAEAYAAYRADAYRASADLRSAQPDLEAIALKYFSPVFVQPVEQGTVTAAFVQSISVGQDLNEADRAICLAALKELREALQLPSREAVRGQAIKHLLTMVGCIADLADEQFTQEALDELRRLAANVKAERSAPPAQTPLNGWQKEALQLRRNFEDDGAAIHAFTILFESYLPAAKEGRKQKGLALLCLALHHVAMRFHAHGGKRTTAIMNGADLEQLPESIFPKDRIIPKSAPEAEVQASEEKP